MALRLERAFGADRHELLELQAASDRERHRGEEAEVAVRGYVPSFLTIQAREIERWADHSEARDHLAVLLRKLVHGTARDLERVDFPGFDNSQRPGWDGWVEAGTATAWIPKGVSGWEFSAERDPGRKANADYAKRLSLPPMERGQCTFVFVTPRNWRGKDAWVKSKEAAGDGWKAVRAYDASDLEQWLEESIAAPIWLAENLPMPITGVRTLVKCWEHWAQASTPRMTERIFEPAVATAIEKFTQWLTEPPSRPFVVASDSVDETLAFLRCLFRQDGVPTAKRDLAAVFDSPETLATVASSSCPLIPIAANVPTERVLSGLTEQSHCLVVRPRSAVDVEPDISLELLGHDAFEEALREMGIDRHEAEHRARESGRSPTVLRRQLARIPALRNPPWSADASLARQLIPMTLAGAWEARRPADREVLSALADCSYEDIEQNIALLLQHDDCPVWSVGHNRGVASKLDCLFAIAPLITENHLQKFLATAEHVLSESDPALELPDDQRWAASFYNKTRDHSRTLLHGIRETLVILAIHGSSLFQARLGIDLAESISDLVGRLLTPLTPDRLASQQPDLPTYAEAAPDRFLTIIEQDLDSDEAVVLGLLRPASSFPGDCPRTGLLWALECVSWNPQWLTRACTILADLSGTAIRDNWANKPIESLRGVLRSWMPQTAAVLSERLSVLKMLTRCYPNIGWQLCVGELDALPRLATDSYRPRWRSDATGFGKQVTEAERNAFVNQCAELALSWPNHTVATLKDLLERVSAFDHGQQRRLWQTVSHWTDRETDEDLRADLRECIRRHVPMDTEPHSRNSHPELTRRVYDRLRPRDPVARHAWLFASAWIDEPQGKTSGAELDHDERIVELDKLRTEAMDEIWRLRGVTGVLSAVEGSNAEHFVGHYAAVATDAHAVIELLRAALSDRSRPESKLDAFMEGLIAYEEVNRELGLVLNVGRDVESDSAERLFRCAPFGRQTWRILDDVRPELCDGYWERVSPRGWKFTDEECSEIVDRLLDARRPQAAVEALHLIWRRVETSRLQRLLLDVASVDAEAESHLLVQPYQVSQALAELDGRPEITPSEMAQLEFAFVAALERSKHGIPNLQRLISETPSLFVQLLANCYKRRDEGRDPPEWVIDDPHARQNAAHLSFRVLDRLDRIPGTMPDGTISHQHLRQWLKETRALCAEVGRARIGDQEIGKLLSKAPPDADGAWPCEVVCSAMEAVAREHFVEGFAMGKYNQRGLVQRGEGGTQERALATKYRNLARRRIDYPVVSRALERIASSYEHDAKFWDVEETLDRRLNR